MKKDIENYAKKLLKKYKRKYYNDYDSIKKELNKYCIGLDEDFAMSLKKEFFRQYILSDETSAKNFCTNNAYLDSNESIKNIMALASLDEESIVLSKLFDKELHLVLTSEHLDAICYALKNNLDKEILEKITEYSTYSKTPNYRTQYSNHFIFSPEQIKAITDFNKEIKDKNLTNLVVKTNYYKNKKDDEYSSCSLDYDEYVEYRRTLKDFTIFNEKDIRNLTEIFKIDEEEGIKLTKLEEKSFGRNEDFKYFTKSFSTEEISEIKNNLISKQLNKNIENSL